MLSTAISLSLGLYAIMVWWCLASRRDCFIRILKGLEFSNRHL
jgi:hypothetical protein